MNTTLLDGKKLRDKKYQELIPRINKLTEEGKQPHLAVVLVGNDPASEVYVRNKELACAKLGIKSTKIALPENIEWEELVQEVNKLNLNPEVDGILIQLPLPKEFSKRAISLLVDPRKDVDGVHPFNQGINFTRVNEYAPIPCTPNGIMEFFKEYNISLAGKHAVVVGRSNIVGRPISYLLAHANATVSLVHSQTPEQDFNDLIKSADIIILATGIKDLVKPEMVKQGVTIIDVGIIRNEEGKIRGEIKHEDFLGVASHITPVPGGVGPMTITMLMENVVTLTEKYKK